MNVRKSLALLLSFVTLFALLTGSAGALPMPPAHHGSGASHLHACHDASTHAPGCADLADVRDTASGDTAANDAAVGCAQSRHACCPGFAATLPAQPALPRFERDGEPVGFRSGLRLVAHPDGIFRPPRRVS